jgi:ATP-binding cassette subfamily B protein
MAHAGDRRGWAGGGAMPGEKSGDFGTALKRLGRLLSTEGLLLVFVGILVVTSVALMAVGPALLGRATDLIVTGIQSDAGVDFDAVQRTLLVAAGLYVLGTFLRFAQNYLLAGVVQRTVQTLRAKVEDKIHRLPLSQVDRMPRGDLMSRVTNDIDNLAQSLQQTMSNIISSILMLVGVVIMMFVVSPFLAGLAVMALPLTFLAMRQIAAQARPRYLKQWGRTGELNTQVEEVFTGHNVVKSFGRRNEVEQRFAQTNQELHDAAFSAQFLASLIQPVTLFAGNLQYLLLAVVGGLRIASGSASVGEVQAIIQYSRQFTQPLSQLVSMATVFQSGIASLERVLELLDSPEISPDPEPVASVPAAATAAIGRVDFEQVTFSYRADEPLITGFSLTAEPGQTIAIVGPTGAGKTTLVNLLLRFYELDGGRILLDGRDITSMPRAELRSAIGMVLQDTWLFGGTIWDNLAYGNPEADDQQILAASEAAYVDRFVRALPDGYQTVINDDGDNISAGEKQLITIARAFLSEPSILVLDEATSSVDTRTEVLIQKALVRLRAHRTSFVIAHRLSTIRGADTIVVLKDGAIVEQGTHDQLVATAGHYAELHRAQFAATEAG